MNDHPLLPASLLRPIARYYLAGMTCAPTTGNLHGNATMKPDEGRDTILYKRTD